MNRLTGSHRNEVARDRAHRWWAVTALAAAVAATSAGVPALLAPTGAVEAASTVERSADPTSPPSAVGFPSIRIAATDAGNERYGAKAIACPTCASGSRVQYLGQGHALVVHVRDVRIAGARTLTIVYETQGARPLDVIINGGRTISLTLPGKDGWTTPAEVSLPIDLPVGDTVIRLFHAERPAPDIDQIVIT